MRPNTIMYPPNDIQPLGIIEFVHGIGEHRKRYIKTMRFFNQKGFICAIADLHGHGENIMSKDDLGHFGDHCTYKDILEDVHNYTMYLKREYLNLPLILFGHGFGSLVVRAYAIQHSKDIHALIISGSPSPNAFLGIAKATIRILATFKGWRYHSRTIERLVTGSFDKPFFKEGLKNSWLSGYRKAVVDYNADPLCGFSLSLNGYYVLISLMKYVYEKNGRNSKNPSLPVMFLSGCDDPCKLSEASFKKTVSFFKRCGYPNTYYKLYSKMRHEPFHELNNSEVYEDILKFLEIKAGFEIPE